MIRFVIVLSLLALCAVSAHSELLRITDVRTPPGLQFNMLQYPYDIPLNRDLENFGIGLPLPFPSETLAECDFPACPQALTFDFPKCLSMGASHVNLFIDGMTLVNNSGATEDRLRWHTVPGYPQLIPGAGSPDTIWTKWYINSPGYPYQIEFNEWNWIDYVEREGIPYPAVFFRFKVINLDAIPHTVSVLLNLDVYLGNRHWCTDCDGGTDDPDIQVGGLGTLLRNTREFGLTASPPIAVPGFAQFYERGPTWPDTNQIIVYADFRAPGLTAPDFVGFGNGDIISGYRSIRDWDLADSSLITDAAMLVAWGPTVLEPSDEVRWTTRIGLGPASGDCCVSMIQVNPIILPDMWFDRCRALPETLMFNYQLLNTHLTNTAHDVGARMEFLGRAACFTFVGSDSFTLSPDSLMAYTFAPAVWRVHFDPTACALPSGVDSLRVPLRVVTFCSTPGFLPDTSYDTITVRWHEPCSASVDDDYTPYMPFTMCDSVCVTWPITHNHLIPAESIYVYVNGIRVAVNRADSCRWLDAPGDNDTLRICLHRPPSDTAHVQLRRFYDVYGGTEDPPMVHTRRIRWVHSLGTATLGWNLVAQSHGTRWGPDPMPSGIASGFWTYSPVGYALADSLDQGQGGWVLASAESVGLSQIGCGADSATFDVFPGWNLIGGLSTPVRISTLVVDPPGALLNTWYTTDDRGMYIDETLWVEIGKGYWVLAADSARVTIHR